jgi:hypothetical protein
MEGMGGMGGFPGMAGMSSMPRSPQATQVELTCTLEELYTGASCQAYMPSCQLRFAMILWLTVDDGSAGASDAILMPHAEHLMCCCCCCAFDGGFVHFIGPVITASIHGVCMLQGGSGS